MAPMKGLNRSASLPAVVPTIAPAVALGIAASAAQRVLQAKAKVPGAASGRSPLLEGTLYVARPADSHGPAEWDPFRFAHHPDGSLSFRAVNGRSQKFSSDEADGGLPFGKLSGVPRGGSSEEMYLDADWRQPFVAAPWKPLSRRDSGKDGASDGEFFPFTLSYAPARPMPGDAESTRRRTVVLAAANARARTRWLATFARKAYSPELRSDAPTTRPGATSGPSGRKVGTLGEEHVGLPTKAGRGNSMPRLPAGPATLFDSHSSLRIVRDLYDGYAADPLSQNPKGQRHMSSTDSDSSGTGPPSASRTMKSRFLERYLDRQSEIESLLDHHWSGASGPPPFSPSLSSGAPVGTDNIEKPVSSDSCVKQSIPSSRNVTISGGSFDAVGSLGDDWGALFPNRVKLAEQTPNVAFEGTSNVLTNTQWSGGAIFAPRDETSFRLTICPLDSLEDHPIFIGLAPPDADLNMISFYSSGGGIFLCAGGRASDDLISALGAPGGPAFFCFGERQFASLPVPEPGHTISMHYTEDRTGGQATAQVRFFISTADGQEVKSDYPPLANLPPGPWRPCVLLCMPETRVHVVRLI